MDTGISHFRSTKLSGIFHSCVPEIVFGMIILRCVLIITCLVLLGGR